MAVNDWETALEAVYQQGAVIVRGFVGEPLREEILMDVDKMSLEEFDERARPIAEQFEAVTLDQPERWPSSIRQLGQKLVALTNTVPAWQPNHVLVQRYLPEHHGIDFHRDYTCDRYLIAVNTIEGEALFEVYSDGSNKPVGWQVEPGDLVLMRGSLLTGQKDDRPRHRIYPPAIGQRLAVTYRHVQPLEDI